MDMSCVEKFETSAMLYGKFTSLEYKLDKLATFRGMCHVSWSASGVKSGAAVCGCADGSLHDSAWRGRGRQDLPSCESWHRWNPPE